MTDKTEGTDASWREGMLTDAEHMDLEDQMKAEEDLRAKSDALLRLCGCRRKERQCSTGMFITWRDWNGKRLSPTPHPYESIDDAVRLAEAMGLKVWNVEGVRMDPGGYSAMVYSDRRYFNGRGPTISEAICAAIEEAVK